MSLPMLQMKPSVTWGCTFSFPLYQLTMNVIFLPPMVGIWVASSLGLWILLCVNTHVHSVVGVPGSSNTESRDILMLCFVETGKKLSGVVLPVCTPASIICGPPRCSASSSRGVRLPLSFLLAVWWHRAVCLIDICLTANETCHLFACLFRPPGYPTLWSAC